MARVLIRVYHFNSRLREGTNTFFQVFFKRTFSITTHTPTRRRTDGIVASIAAPSFQITSLQGDEQYGLSPITVWCHFNSRFRKETNKAYLLTLLYDAKFQLTPPQRDEL